MNHQCHWTTVENVFVPREAAILRVAQPTAMEKHFTLKMADEKPMQFQPGQILEVSLGAGAKENFRETRGWRFRHRLMRKAAYLNEKLGGPACVGCGRCSQACPADIADPVRVIGTIMASQEQ